MRQLSGSYCQVPAPRPSPDDSVCLSENLLFGEDDQDDTGFEGVTDTDGTCDCHQTGTYNRVQKTMQAMMCRDSAVPQAVFDVLSDSPSNVEAVASDLARANPAYNVFVRQSTSTRNKATCLTRLWHKSIVMEQDLSLPVINSADKPTTIIVDLSFRESFAIPHPSARYSSILELLPEAFATSSPRFFDLVEFLAKEMTQEFLSSGLPVPPWRTPAALRSKWSKATSFDVLMSACGPAVQTPARQQRKLLSQHLAMDIPRHVVLGFSIQASGAQDPEPQCPSSAGKSSMALCAAMSAGGITAARWQQHSQQRVPGARNAESHQCSQQQSSHASHNNLAVGRCQTARPLESLLLPVRTVKLAGKAIISHPAALVA